MEHALIFSINWFDFWLSNNKSVKSANVRLLFPNTPILLYESGKKAAGMRVRPVRKIYYMWGRWGRFNVEKRTENYAINQLFTAQY